MTTKTRRALLACAEALREAVKAGRHDPDCHGETKPCACGLSRARAALATLDATKGA